MIKLKQILMTKRRGERFISSQSSHFRKEITAVDFKADRTMLELLMKLEKAVCNRRD